MSKVFYPQARAVLQVVFDGFGGLSADTAPKIIPVIPKEVSIHRNTYKQADGWEMTFDAHDFPIDPQLVRAGSAEIYLFATEGLRDDQRLLSRQLTSQQARYAALYGTDGVATLAEEQNLALSKRDFTLGQAPQIFGLFDDHSIDFSSSGRWVTISGQDYTAFLAARQWGTDGTISTKKAMAANKSDVRRSKRAGKKGKGGGPLRRIPTGERLDLLLAKLLVEADPRNVMTFRVEGIDEEKLPVVGKNAPRSQKRGIPTTENMSYWDVMYGLALRHGCILFVRGLDVVLARPQNLNGLFDPRIKRLAWGKNIESLQMSRRLGKEKVPRIVVRAYDETGRQTTEVEYPEGKQEVPNGTLGVSQDEFELVPVYGITDRAVLLDLAESLFHLRGHTERTVVLRTQDLEDLGFNGQAAHSLMNLAAGDAVAVEFLEFNLNHAMLQDGSIAEEVKVQHLVARGYNYEIAQIIAQRYQALKFLQRPLRIREVSFEYSADDGISIEMELVDFIVVDGAREPENKPTRNAKRSRKLQKAKKA